MSDLANITGSVARNGGMVQQPDTRMVRFANVPQLNEIASRQQGRPIYDPCDVLFVRQAGERDEIATRVKEHHKFEFAQQWQAYEEGREADLAPGTPLAILFPNSPHIVEALRAVKVFTVEALGGLGEEGLRRIGMGAREYQAKAKQFLEQAERSAPLQKVEAELRERDERIAALTAQVELLAAGVARRGRPRKGAAEEIEDGEE